MKVIENIPDLSLPGVTFDFVFVLEVFFNVIVTKSVTKNKRKYKINVRPRKKKCLGSQAKLGSKSPGNQAFYFIFYFISRIGN